MSYRLHLIDSGGALVYSTYLGGSNYEYGYAIAVDRKGNAYITGETGTIYTGVDMVLK